MLTGDYVARSEGTEWSMLHARWDRVVDGIIALPGYGERRGDRALAGHGAAFAGQGVPELRGVPFWHFDIQTSGVRWRFVMLDADARSLRHKWRDQLFWLPKVITGETYDHLVVAINRPLNELAGGVRADTATHVSTLLRVIDAHASPTRVAAVIGGGAPSNHVALPSGRFGVAHVVAGNAGVSAADLSRVAMPFARDRPVELEAQFAAALDAELGHWGLEEEPGDDGARWVAEALPVVGWWQVEIDGDAVGLEFQIQCKDGSFHEVYRLVFTRERGWASEVVGFD